jgi:hypothetical protein
VAFSTDLIRIGMSSSFQSTWTPLSTAAIAATTGTQRGSPATAAQAEPMLAKTKVIGAAPERASRPSCRRRSVVNKIPLGQMERSRPLVDCHPDSSRDLPTGKDTISQIDGRQDH